MTKEEAVEFAELAKRSLTEVLPDDKAERLEHLRRLAGKDLMADLKAKNARRMTEQRERAGQLPLSSP